jgi:hypothetical protein
MIGNVTARLPNFLVVGAPKSGTTSLYEYLRPHPQVFLPERKELHYFSYQALARDVAGPGDAQTLSELCADRAAYASHYAGVGEQPAVGDISPSYLYFADEVIPRIRAELRSPRIIVLLRDPVRKCHSQYMHMVREGLEPLGFAAALAAEQERRASGWGNLWRYRESSLYAERVAAFVEAFGTERLAVRWFEDFAADPTAAVRGVCEFLEIDPDVETDTGRVHNRTGRPRARWLARMMFQDSPAKRAVKAVVPGGLRQHVRTAVSALNTGAKEPIPIDVHASLRDYFAPDVERLAAVLGTTPPWEL